MMKFYFHVSITGDVHRNVNNNLEYYVIIISEKNDQFSIKIIRINFIFVKFTSCTLKRTKFVMISKTVT
jgi:hypothetical protein